MTVKVIMDCSGTIAELVTARKAHRSACCGLPIEVGEEHYRITIGGGGLGSLKFPDRVHERCIKEYLRRKK